MDIKILIITLNVFTSIIIISLIMGIIYKKENIIAYKGTLLLIVLNSILLTDVYFVKHEFINLAFRNTLPITSLFIFRYIHRDVFNQFENKPINAIKDIIIRSAPYIILFVMALSTIQTLVNQQEEIAVIGAFDSLVFYSIVLYQLLVMGDLLYHNIKVRNKVSAKYQQTFTMNIFGIVAYVFILTINIVSGTLEGNLILSGMMYCIIGIFLMINHVYKEYTIVEDVDNAINLTRKTHTSINETLSIDSLTGVYKREFFNRNIHTFDSDNANTSVVIMKMTGLKLINESFGYEQGDEILQEIALIVSEIFSDSVIARMGGSQFVITQSDLSEDQLNEKIMIIENICKDRDGFVVNVYFGVFMKRQSDIALEQIYARAEEDLYYNRMLKNRKEQRKLSDSLWKNFARLSPSLSRHLERCASLAETFGKYMLLSEDELTDLRNAALLHDIALTIMPNLVEYRVAFENDFEEKSYKNHTLKGYDIAVEAGINPNAAKAILYHHENTNGTGYPHRLSGDNIPYLSQIITLVDRVDMLMHYDNEVDSLENILLSKIGIEFSKEIVYNMIGFLKKTEIIKEN